MLFGQEERLDINKYVKEELLSLSKFCDSLSSEKTLFLKGYGFFKYDLQEQFNETFGYYLLKINDRIFSIGGVFIDENNKKEGGPIRFHNVKELEPRILSSSIFESSSVNSSNNHADFEAALPIEAKIYLYRDEEKILFSKSGEGNIDLYSSYQVKTNTNELIGKVYPAAFNSAKKLAMSNLLEERIKNLKK